MGEAEKPTKSRQVNNTTIQKSYDIENFNDRSNGICTSILRKRYCQ